MIDIHAHILPGLDDGAEDLYDTLEMASMAVESGVKAMIATPHCNIPGIFKNYFGEAYLEAFHAADRAIMKERIPLQLYPGMEVFGTYDLPQLLRNEKIMTLNESHYLLIEFSFDEDPDFVSDLLQRVCEIGVKPIIAHAERYEFVHDDTRIVYEWRKKGYAVQANKGSFLGRFGRKAWETAYQLLDHNLISVVASDAHSPYRRTPYMLDAYEALLDDFEKKYLDILFKYNPACICNDKDLISPGEISIPDYN